MRESVVKMIEEKGKETNMSAKYKMDPSPIIIVIDKAEIPPLTVVPWPVYSKRGEE